MTEKKCLSFVIFELNAEEAKIVAEWAVKHYQTYGTQKSLGIITCAKKQVGAIKKAINNLPGGNVPYFKGKGSFFVEHVDDVQGIERDVIFFSVAFGRLTNRQSEVDSSLFMQSFRKKNGGRLLNVLITRARERCVVFANFKAHQLTSDHTELKKFSNFLKHAENTNLKRLNMDENQNISDPFEKIVYRFLIEEFNKEEYENYIVTTPHRYGTTEYKIHLSIFDLKKNTHLLGIEFDNEQYSQFDEATDRDKIRPRMLKNLGWRIHQVWSIGWYRNPETEKQLLRNAVKLAAAQMDFDDITTDEHLELMKQVLEKAPKRTIQEDELINETIKEFTKNNDHENIFEVFFESKSNRKVLREDVTEEIVKPRLIEALEEDKRQGELSKFEYNLPDGLVSIEQ